MASETKHTPGPWRSEPDGMGDITIASNRDQLAIAAVVNGGFMAMGGHTEEFEANARLIAGAPDMLSALVVAEYALAALAETFEYDEDDDAEMACAFEMLCGETVCQECGCIRDKRDACRAAIAKASSQAS